MPRVIVPPPYRGPTEGLDRIEVGGETVRDCLEAMAGRFPGFGEQIFDAEGRVHRFVTLFLNGDELDRQQALDQAVAEGDDVEILAAIAGG
jgi:sulfur carrier protein ThiS